MMRPSNCGPTGTVPARLTRNDPRIRPQAVRIAGWHQVETLAGEADHFGFDAAAVGRHDIAAVADGGLAAHRFQRQTHHAREAALHRRGRQALDLAHAAGQ